MLAHFNVNRLGVDFPHLDIDRLMVAELVVVGGLVSVHADNDSPALYTVELGLKHDGEMNIH